MGVWDAIQNTPGVPLLPHAEHMTQPPKGPFGNSQFNGAAPAPGMDMLNGVAINAPDTQNLTEAVIVSHL